MHRIRLAGPWEMVRLDTPDKSVRITMPVDWADLPDNPGGAIRFRRTFHAPTGVEPTDRVRIIFPVLPDAVALDGKPQVVEQLAVDVTAALADFHVLDVTISSAPGLSEPVWLEIDDSKNTPDHP